MIEPEYRSRCGVGTPLIARGGSVLGYITGLVPVVLSVQGDVYTLAAHGGREIYVSEEPVCVYLPDLAKIAYAVRDAAPTWRARNVYLDTYGTVVPCTHLHDDGPPYRAVCVDHWEGFVSREVPDGVAQLWVRTLASAFDVRRRPVCVPS